MAGRVKEAPTSYLANGVNGNNFPADDGTLQRLVEAQNFGAKAKYTHEIGARYIELIREGYTEKKAAEKIGVTRSTVYRWKLVMPSFQNMVAQAQEMGTDAMVEDAVDLLHSIDLSEGDPKMKNVEVRLAEVRKNTAFDVARVRSARYTPKQANINLTKEIKDEDFALLFNR